MGLFRFAQHSKPVSSVNVVLHTNYIIDRSQVKHKRPEDSSGILRAQTPFKMTHLAWNREECVLQQRITLKPKTNNPIKIDCHSAGQTQTHTSNAASLLYEELKLADL